MILKLNEKSYLMQDRYNKGKSVASKLIFLLNVIYKSAHLRVKCESAPVVCGRAAAQVVEQRVAHHVRGALLLLHRLEQRRAARGREQLRVKLLLL